MTTLLRRVQFDVDSAYHQFYLQDLDDQEDPPADWTNDDVNNRAKGGEKLLALCPLRDTTVPVALELHSGRPELDLDEWDHVVEAPLLVASGRLQVAMCPDGWIGAFPVRRGHQRVRFASAGGDTITSRGLEGDDYYLVQAWPSEARPLEVIKRGAPRC